MGMVLKEVLLSQDVCINGCIRVFWLLFFLIVRPYELLFAGKRQPSATLIHSGPNRRPDKRGLLEQKPPPTFAALKLILSVFVSRTGRYERSELAPCLHPPRHFFNRQSACVSSDANNTMTRVPQMHHLFHCTAGLTSLTQGTTWMACDGTEIMIYSCACWHGGVSRGL